MAKLGSLFFDIGLNDRTEKDWERIIKNVEKKGAKLGITIDEKNLHSQISQALQNRKYTIDLSLAIKDNQLEAAIQRAYSRVSGAAGSMAGSIRPSREDQLIRAGAYASSQQALERSRNALAELREARLRDAEAARQQKAANAELNNAMVKTNSIASQLRNEILGVYSIYTIQNFLRSVIEIGGEFEKQQIALGSILRDAGQATEIFSNIKNLAVVSPFGIRELTAYTKQLAAFSIPYNELYDTTKRLADISAGLGVDMSRIILAYGQVRSAEFLKGTELRQFTEAGIPLIQALADKFTELEGKIVSVGDVMDMISKRKVSFEDVKDVLWEMTETGGMFDNMQEELSESLAGKWSNLKDAYDIMLADIAESSNSIAKGMIEGLTDVMRNWEYLIPLIVSAASGLGVYKASLVGLNTLHGKENASILKNAMLLKQKQVNILRVAQSYRTLTQAELGAIVSSGKMTTADYRQLAVSGQLTREYALRLIALGKLKAGQAGHIAQLLQISRAEMAAASNAGKWRVMLSSAGASIRAIGASLKSLMFNPFTIIFAGLSVALELYTSWKQKNDEMKRNIEELAQKANEGYKNIHNQLKQFDKIEVGKINDDSLISSIEQIADTLKNYSPRYNDIQKESDAIEELVDRYKYLLDALHETEDAYKILEDIKDISEDANANTDGWFDESLRENMQDYSEALQDAQKKLRDLSKYSINIGAAIQEAANSDEGFAKAISGKTLNQQIALLMDYSKAYGNVLNSLSGKIERPALIAYFDAVRESNAVFKNEVLPDVESYSDYIKESLEAEGWDFSKLTKAQEDALRMAVVDFTKKIPDITEEARKKIEDEVLTVRFRLSPIIEDYDAKPILGNYATLMKSVSGNLFSDKELSSVHSAASAYELWSSRMKEAEEELASLKRMKEKAMTPEQKDYYEAELKASQAQYDAYKKVGDLLFNEEKKKEKKGRDAIADQWKERINLIEKAISTYKEWAALEGKDKAYQRVQSNQTFSPVLSYIGTAEDISDPSKIWERVLKEIPKDKKELVMDIGFKVEKSNQDKLKSDIDKSLKDVEEHIKKTTEQWNLYKNLLQSGVSGDVAMRLSFGGDNPFANIAEQYKAEIAKALKESKTTISMEQLLGMDEKSMNAAFGAELGGELAKLVQEYKDANDEIYHNTLTNAAKLITQNRSYEDQIIEIKRKANEDIKNLEAQRAKFGDETTDKAIAQRRVNEQKEIGDVRFEQFKNTDDWEKAFGDLDKLTTTTINRMIASFIAFREAQRQNLSVDDIKKLSDIIEKMQREVTARNPFERIALGFKNLKAARKSGGDTKSAWAEISDGLKGVEGQINDCVGAAGDLQDMFDSIGDDSLADMMGLLQGVGSGISNLVGAASSFASGNVLGGVTGAVSGITGIISSIANFHDKKLDKAIERSELKVKQLENAYKNLERTINRQLGAITERQSREMLSSLKRQRDELEEQMRMESEKKDSDPMKIEDYKAQIAELNDQIQYFYEDLMSEQFGIDLKDWASQISDAITEAFSKGEDAAKAFDDTVANIMRNIVNEMFKMTLVEPALEQLREMLYGNANMTSEIDKQIDALHMESVNTSDRNKRNEIMRKIQALQKERKKYEGVLLDGELSEEDINLIADSFEDMKEKIPQWEELWDKINEATGGILDQTEEANEGLSGEMQGITEDTADLLASYINAVRGDVSLERGYIEKIANEMFPKMSVIAQAQLTQLELIARYTEATASNTSRNADLVGEIRDIINGARVNKEKGFYIR